MNEHRKPRWALYALLAAATIGAGYELRTAAIEARLFSKIASALDYAVEPGKSDRIVFPEAGPMDRRRGYSRIPEFAERLDERGYSLVAQARHSRALSMASKLGIPPPYAESSSAGLVIEGFDGSALYDATAAWRGMERFDSVPSVVVQTLLFIENRELAEGESPYRNPAIDWGRFGKAVLLYTASRLGLPFDVEGGSTLAVQLEKYRHSPGGRTESGVDKLRQMLSASLRVYRDGPVTTDARKRIVLDYVNTMPLAGAPGYGEVAGLEEGLRVWFGRDPDRTYRALRSRSLRTRARAVKPMLALLCAVRAPTRYLITDREALNDRVNAYTVLLTREGILDAELAEAVRKEPLRFATRPGSRSKPVAVGRGAQRIRDDLVTLLDLKDYYELDRLHLTVGTTVLPGLQRDATLLFRQLGDTSFVRAKGLRGERLLARGDPDKVIYSLLLCERTPDGNVVRVHADNLNQPFDMMSGMKMELGSTAKLRTLVHYLELVSRLYDEISPRDPLEIAALAAEGGDPITEWTAQTLLDHPEIGREDLLERSLDREYSANPYELFYTGGGFMSFQNFDADDNGRILTLREAAARSTNLVFVRLMRDLVRYHAARLPYDTRAVLDRDVSPERTTMLHQVADEEGSPEEMGWLFRTRNRRAQDLRLRARIERDAFARMTPYWRHTGFPFRTLVPSYATAIGSSGDRPAALADLMGILMNDGVRGDPRMVQRVTFATGTPYETSFVPPESAPTETVLEPAVARVARRVLASVVESGTAIRLRGAFVDSTTGSPAWIAGKTGTGDNRHETFGRGRRLIASRAVSRTATFAFLLGDRYYGVLTALVTGPEADRFRFTSSLPLAVMQLLAPSIDRELDLRGAPEGIVLQPPPPRGPTRVAGAPVPSPAAAAAAPAGATAPAEAATLAVPAEAAPPADDPKERTAGLGTAGENEKVGDKAALEEMPTVKARKEKSTRASRPDTPPPAPAKPRTHPAARDPDYTQGVDL
jgi:membrane peptidoglycan carboxypeptidase